MFLEMQSFSVTKRRIFKEYWLTGSSFGVYHSPPFKLTCQTKSALVTTLRAQADLIDKLIDDGYEFVRTARFQSNPTERRFSQYQQMSGGRFLLSLKEVLN